MLNRMHRITLVVGILVLSGSSHTAIAANADTLLQLLKKKPSGMTRETWLEQRREAVRELGKLRERRAVPILLRIVRGERFDVILERAIDALGNIRDRRAVAPLRALLGDPSVDSYVKDAARRALAKLRPRSRSPNPSTEAVPTDTHTPETQPNTAPAAREQSTNRYGTLSQRTCQAYSKTA